MRLARQGAALGLLAFFAGYLPGADSGAIRWYQDVAQASAAAREANKPMLLDFWAGWCAPCKIMEKDVYSDPSVVEAASTKFLPVPVDFDHQQKLARKYHVTSLPTIVFTDSYGAELFRCARLNPQTGNPAAFLIPDSRHGSD